MAKLHFLAATAAFVLFALPSSQAMYTKSSPVLQLNERNYEKLIAKSNYTSIVEFYAPWCGHCKNLKPAYEKAAKNLAGLAKVAAVDCDDEANKNFCGKMGVQGFPTLKIVKPGKKPGKPIVEDYEGARSAKGIVDAVTGKIANHVKRLNDKDYQVWARDLGPRAILFSEKGTTSPLLKSLAIDFLGSMKFGQLRETQKATVSQFGIETFPKLVVVPADSSEPALYEGEMKKAPMLEFLSQFATPNPDSGLTQAKAGKETKKETKKDTKKAKEAKEKFEKSSASQAKSEASEDAAGATSVVVEDEKPTESPDPQVSPDAPKPEKIIELPPPISQLATGEELQKACLGATTSTCVLALVPDPEGTSAAVLASAQALSALADISDRHKKRQTNLFPFYSVPNTNPSSEALRVALQLNEDPDIEIIAVNAKKGWWKRYTGKPTPQSIDLWIDGIRFGEGKKNKLPADIIPEEVPVTDGKQVPIQDPDHDEL